MNDNEGANDEPGSISLSQMMFWANEDAREIANRKWAVEQAMFLNRDAKTADRLGFILATVKDLLRFILDELDHDDNTEAPERVRMQ